MSLRGLILMNGKISLDTNIVIRLLKNDKAVVNLLSRKSMIYLPIPVTAELLFAAKNSGRPKDNLKTYNEFIDPCRVLNITRKTADRYSTVRLQLKQKGRPIPENDVWIAAVCIENDLPIITPDTHFDNVEGLEVVNV